MAMELFLAIDALDGNAFIDPLILPSLHTFWQAPFMYEMHNCIVLDVAIGTILSLPTLGVFLNVVS
jgi:hypothetical protein